MHIIRRTFIVSALALVAALVGIGTSGPAHAKELAQPDMRIRADGFAQDAGDGIYNANGVDQTIEAPIVSGGSQKFQVTIENDGPGKAQFVVFGNRCGAHDFVTRFKRNGQNITSAVSSGTYVTEKLASGSAATIIVRVKARASTIPGDFCYTSVEASGSTFIAKSDIAYGRAQVVPPG